MRRPSREFKAEPSELEGRWLLSRGHASIPTNEYVQFKQGLISPLMQGPGPTGPVAGQVGAVVPVANVTTRGSGPPAQAAGQVATVAAVPTQVSGPPAQVAGRVGTVATVAVAPAQASGTPTQVVGQQDGEATVVLTRSDNRGRLQVRVTTDPSSPAVGVNVGAVDQTVTFPNLRHEVVVRVPILAGAPNPGEVDVNLILTPITPRVTTSGPLELRILASDAAIPPKIVSVEGKPQAIVLTFNKPMDPVAASDVKNYAVTWRSIHSKHADLGPLALAVPGWWYDSSTSSGPVSLRSARYDPATHSVTLITRRTINYARTNGINLSEGHPVKHSGRTGDQSGPGQGLTDLDGNPINADTSPGKFSDYVFKGLQPTG